MSLTLYYLIYLECILQSLIIYKSIINILSKDKVFLSSLRVRFNTIFKYFYKVVVCRQFYSYHHYFVSFVGRYISASYQIDGQFYGDGMTLLTGFFHHKWQFTQATLICNKKMLLSPQSTQVRLHTN